MRDHSYNQFRAFYAQYLNKIYSYLYYRVGHNRDVAEDLASDVFLRALENFTSFNPKESFGAWIYTIARNRLIDHYRSTKSHVALDDISETHAAEQRDLGKDLDTTAHLQRVITTIHKLPDNYREVLTLKYLNGFENKEIEDMLGKSQTNVRVLVHRALTALKQRLEPSA